MTQDWRQALAHVLWIGGATDSGKTTLADRLAERHHLQVYHYDRSDRTHHGRLAQVNPVYQAFMAATLDERWVDPTPQELFERMLESSHDRMPLVIEDLIALPHERGIVAEGFGLLPELLASLLSRPDQALWLVSTEAFKLASMKRRGKPSFGAQVSDPERATANLIERDRLLAKHLRRQAALYGYTLFEVDGHLSTNEMADRLEQHFAWFLGLSTSETPG